MRAASAASTAYVRGDATPGNIAEVVPRRSLDHRLGLRASPRRGVLVAGTAVLAFDSGGSSRARARSPAWSLGARRRCSPSCSRASGCRARAPACVALAGLALLDGLDRDREVVGAAARRRGGRRRSACRSTWAPSCAALLAFPDPTARRWVEPALALRGGRRRRLRAVGPVPPGRARTSTVRRGRGPAGAAAHVLERDGRACGDRASCSPSAWPPTRRAALAARRGRGGDAAARPRRLPLVLARRDPRRGARAGGAARARSAEGQVAAAAIALVGGIVAAAARRALPAVESLTPGRDAEREGLEMLLITAALACAAGVATHLLGGGAEERAALRRAARRTGSAPCSPSSS